MTTATIVDLKVILFQEFIKRAKTKKQKERLKELLLKELIEDLITIRSMYQGDLGSRTG